MATYGSINDEKGPSVGFKDPHQKIQMEENFDPKNPFDENFDEEFWIKVKNLFNSGKNGVSHASAQRRVRVDRFKESCEEKDPLVYLLTVIHDRYKDYCTRQENFEKYPTFVFELSEFASVLLIDDVKATPEDEESTYEQLVDVEIDDSMKSPLHLAAERNLVTVAKILISLHPNIVYLTTMEDEYPLNFALIKKHDEVARLLVDNMDNRRVRELFEESARQEAQFHFQDFVMDPKMKETTKGILDCTMSPDWPFLPVNKDDSDEEKTYSSFPNEPLRYHVWFTLLDGDGNGRDAKDENGKLVDNFDHRSKSCLQLLADSPVAEEAMRHPSVRLLVRRKWDDYGATYLQRHFFFYVVFLIIMSLAFFLHNESKSSPLKYDTAKDYVRLVCEIITLLYTLVYFLSELDQMEKERGAYWKDFFNYFDLLGLLLIVILIPCRIADSPRVEWAFSSAAFMINFVRVFKFFPAFRTLGLYSKTFAKIIYVDISRFFVVFAIVCVTFTGGIYLALKSARGLDKVGGFWDVFLAEVRALAEANGFADDYDGYSVFIIILIMVNMFSILIILMNILIGQISYRYEEALETATVQYDIDKTKLVTRIENSRFKYLNQRVKYYQRGAYISTEELESELLDDWVTFKKNSTIAEDRKETIKKILSRKIKLLSKDEIRKKED